jgi:hypothetical protein
VMEARVRAELETTDFEDVAEMKITLGGGGCKAFHNTHRARTLLGQTRRRDDQENTRGMRSVEQAKSYRHEQEHIGCTMVTCGPKGARALLALQGRMRTWGCGWARTGQLGWVPKEWTHLPLAASAHWRGWLPAHPRGVTSSVQRNAQGKGTRKVGACWSKETQWFMSTQVRLSVSVCEGALQFVRVHWFAKGCDTPKRRDDS